MEGFAAKACDGSMFLDEMSQVDGQEAPAIVYMLSNGSGKQRASRDGSARERSNSRTTLLSTGELTLEAKMRESHQQMMAGLDVRLPNVPADAGAGMGLFEDLHQ